MQKRKCSIYAAMPITCFQVPIIGHAELNLTTEEIYKCLCAKAEVTEMLPNGKTVNLDFSNYNKQLVETKPKEKIKEVTETPILPEESIVQVVDNTILEVKDEPEETLTATTTVAGAKEDSPVRTHELSSRNNNYNKQNKNRKNKNKR